MKPRYAWKKVVDWSRLWLYRTLIEQQLCISLQCLERIDCHSLPTAPTGALILPSFSVKRRRWGNQVSIFGREKLKTAVVCVEHLCVLGIGQGTFTLLFLILLTNPSNPWLFSINSDLFFYLHSTYND